MHTKLQRGQALILIALGFVALVAFIGLTVDAGIMFIHIGSLRRAVDAAGLAAAGQYLSDTTETELTATVKEFLDLNGIDSSQSTLEIKVCNLPAPPDFSGLHDASLCKENNPWDYDRKLVKVKAEQPVDLAFLPVIGFTNISIKAETTAEAASVDLVLVLDASQSMTYDGPSLPGCNTADTCQPFVEVRASAKRFIQQMSFPYDHVAVVTFSADAIVEQTLTDDKTLTLNKIDTLRVYEQSPCTSLPNPGGCLSSNIGGGLREAGNVFAADGREESLWVTVLLSDGAANQAWDSSSSVWICPTDETGGGFPNWIKPYCVDGDGASRHGPGLWYDPSDVAMDMADLIGCYQNSNPDQSSYCSSRGIDGFEGLIFTIGMGDKIINGPCDPWYATNGVTCHTDLGERLLRYVAAVGDDGNPVSDLCGGFGQKINCGNYYFAQTAADLDPVFTDIAKRVYTRITH